MSGTFSAGGVRLVGLIVLLGGVLAVPASLLAAQNPPPINGVTGTIATDATVEGEHAAAQGVLAKTAHLLHAVFGGRGDGELNDLREGTTVSVRTAAAEGHADATATNQGGDDRSAITEGTVVRVDRSQKRITVRFDHGRTETLQLAGGAGPAAGPIEVSYTDKSGRKVSRYFKKAS
jgi:hypothetical protein